MEEGLKVYLDDPAICAGDSGGDSIWMRDCSGEWFCLEPLKKMIAKTVPKALTDWSWDWSNQWRANWPTHWPTKVMHHCPADLTNNCLVKLRTIKNSYAKEPIVTNDSYGQAETKNNRTIKDQVNIKLRTIDRPSNQGQMTHLSAVGLQQSERLIWERSDCDRPYSGTVDRIQEQVHAPPEVWNRCQFWIKG